MKYLIPVLILSAVFLFQYCKSGKYTPDDYPDAQIVFGSGGGFAGTYNNYYLFENGVIFKNSTSDKAFKKVKKIKKEEARQIFNNFETFNLKDYNFNDPGNLNYFLELKTKEGNHKIQWGGSQEVDGKVKTIYQILMKHISDAKD